MLRHCHCFAVSNTNKTHQTLTLAQTVDVLRTSSCIFRHMIWTFSAADTTNQQCFFVVVAVAVV